ncbi:MAG: fatty acid desaturase [Thiolinea sp.]
MQYGSTLRRIEWKSAGLILICYAAWVSITVWHQVLPFWLLIPVLAVILSFHNSLQHEVIHYHPTPWQGFNESLVHWPLALYLPFIRYRDTHRAHHVYENITLPADDPESYYFSPADWERLAPWQQRLYTLNNALLGRLITGPFLAGSRFLSAEFSAINAGDKKVIHAWKWHLPLLVMVLSWLVFWQFPLWVYLLGVYFSMSLTAIRTFAEHQAAAEPTQRTLVVESRGFFSFLFLNNSLHSVHHKYPGLAWYQLRLVYRRERETILQENGGYVLPNYTTLFRRYLFTIKEPVVYPLVSHKRADAPADSGIVLSAG